MLIKDLIAQLHKLPEDTLVVLSSDSEGNDYSPVSDSGMGIYVAETTYSGQFMDQDEYQSEVKEEYLEEGSGVKAVCIWPLN